MITMFQKFSEYQKQLFQLYSEQRYSEALRIAEEAGRSFPTRAGRTIYWRACLLCRLGKPDEALRVLQEGLRDGHWWGISKLSADADLAPLQGRPDFQEIVAECERRRQAAQAQAKPHLKVLEPVGGSTVKTPVLLALHWAAGNVEDFADYWQAAWQQGWLIALPQSSQICSEDGFWWPDYELGRREVLATFERFRQEYVFCADEIVIAGASQGGVLAVRLALEGAIPCRGFLAVVPSLRDHTVEELIPLLKAAAERGLGGWIITGERDPCLEPTRRFHEQALKHGLRCELFVKPGMGHAFPVDFDTDLLQALAFFKSITSDHEHR